MKLNKVFLGVVFIILLISTLLNSLLEFQKKYHFYLQYKKDYQKAYQKNVFLKTEYLKKSDKEHIEKTARNQLNLAREDEYILILPEPTIVKISPTPAPNYLQWLKLILK